MQVASVVYWLVCLPLDPRDAGSNPAKTMNCNGDKKNPQHTLEVCTGRNFRILPDPARGQFGPTRPEPEYIVCATRPDPTQTRISSVRPGPNPNIICATRPEPEYYSCYLTGPEPEYYLCYPANSILILLAVLRSAGNSQVNSTLLHSFQLSSI
jgi:hypothetical protein